MKSRAEITSRCAKAYVTAGTKDKGKVLDEVVAVTGWSRENARRRLIAAARPPQRFSQPPQPPALPETAWIKQPQPEGADQKN